MNNKPINLLLTSSGTAMDVISHLCNNKLLNVNVIATDIKYNPLIANLCTHFTVPMTSSEEYADYMIQACIHYRIDFIIPCTNSDTEFYSLHYEKFKKINTKPLVSSLRSILDAKDKWRCYEILKKSGIPVPESFLVENVNEFIDAAEKLRFPQNKICFKPAKYPDGSGKGFRIIANDESVFERMFYELTSQMFIVDFDYVIKCFRHVKKTPALIVSEFLEGSEYSVYCFCVNGDAVYIVPNLKLGLSETNSRVAQVDLEPNVISLSKTICKIFSFHGNVNIQFKYDRNDIPKVIEINPRVAGTILLPAFAGVDLLAFSILHELNMEYPKNLVVREGTKIIREMKDYFLYE